MLGGQDTRVIYRHYATLYFVFVVDESESELGILDLIQVSPRKVIFVQGTSPTRGGFRRKKKGRVVLDTQPLLFLVLILANIMFAVL